ncbi:MAG: DPP IV N-terminal domain-containing protein [Bacteroidales bacterium]|nr:MAG: DPP IV N-terminal domain-containing protein [Bacteroidales bacterium]
MKKRFFILFMLLWAYPCLYAQLTVKDYHLADSTEKFRNLAYFTNVRPAWIKGTSSFWYSVNTRKGDEYFLVDRSRLKKTMPFDQEKLCKSINEAVGKEFKPYSIPMRNLTFSKDLKEIEFVIDTVKWKCNLRNYQITMVEKVERFDRRGGRYWGESRDELGNEPVISPDSIWVAFIKNYNVYIRPRNGRGDEQQLSFDGSEGDLYSSYISWSPDSKKLATCKVRPHTKRFFYFVESSPDDQIQPRLHKREYLKPGDAVSIRRPVLFDVTEKKQIEVNSQPFEHQYDLGRIEWRKDSRAYTFEFNQRGHQVYQVVEVNSNTGETRILVDEKSKTFIDYSGKKMRHDVNDGDEIIWASERDGWNHLYLFDGNTGKVKNQITAGEWVVRELLHVDDESRSIIFAGSGRNLNEDPYLVHYYRINFDGSGITDLTPEEASHRATFSEDWAYFVDTWSRVDLPPVTVLRDASDGKIVMELEKADISDLLDEGFNIPEVFVAKGRDGKTDIWGIIYRPSSFDPNLKYPVIEYIYAGPHGSHVPKNFRSYYGFCGLAELGFIIVQIDGMGTSNRSKAFHDICWQNLKDAGYPDRIPWIKAAAEKYSFMDTSRVGIYGTSAGGQNSMGALLFYPEFYKVAVSSCGCHDNRMDKIWWNEQWMGYPVGTHYEESSNVVNAHKLKGKLLLLVGEMDDNVDPSSTMQVVNALIKAGKEFELVVLPGMNHTSGGRYGERKRRDFFVKNLLEYDTPDWNTIEGN